MATHLRAVGCPQLKARKGKGKPTEVAAEAAPKGDLHL